MFRMADTTTEHLGLVDLDDRRRAQLSRFLAPDAPSRYAVDVSADGVITLSPATVITAHELRLLEQRPDLVAKMRAAVADGELPPGGVRRR